MKSPKPVTPKEKKPVVKKVIAKPAGEKKNVTKTLPKRTTTITMTLEDAKSNKPIEKAVPKKEAGKDVRRSTRVIEPETSEKKFFKAIVSSSASKKSPAKVKKPEVKKVPGVTK